MPESEPVVWKSGEWRPGCGVTMISAVLLAAGKSERMGAFKQLLPIDGKTFVEACADNLLASRAGEAIVVTGYNQAAVRAALAGRPLRIVNNPDYETGMGAAISSDVDYG